MALRSVDSSEMIACYPEELEWTLLGFVACMVTSFWIWVPFIANIIYSQLAAMRNLVLGGHVENMSHSVG